MDARGVRIPWETAGAIDNIIIKGALNVKVVGVCPCDGTWKYIQSGWWKKIYIHVYIYVKKGNGTINAFALSRKSGVLQLAPLTCIKAAGAKHRFTRKSPLWGIRLLVAKHQYIAFTGTREAKERGQPGWRYTREWNFRELLKAHFVCIQVDEKQY